MDAGDFTGDDSVPGRMQTEALVEAMNALDYRAVNLSTGELAQGYEPFVARRKAARFAFVSANVVWQDTGEPVVDPFHIETVALREGAAARKVRIGFIGLTRNDPAFLEETPGGRRIVTVDPVAAAARQVEVLGGKTDIIIVLSSLDLNEARRLPKTVRDIDLILGGRGTARTRSDDFPEDTLIGKTRILYIGNQGKNLGEVRLFFDDHKAIASTQRKLVLLTRQWPDDPDLAALMARTRRDVNEWNRTQAAAGPFEPAAVVPTGEAAYTGSARCAACHESEYAVWAESSHAKAFDTLVKAQQDYNPRCVGCHTIGFDRPHGFVNARATPDLIHVGCEACHGPSSRHTEQQPQGYGSAGIGVCRTCHTRENSPEYDPAIYIPKIRHWTNARAGR